MKHAEQPASQTRIESIRLKNFRALKDVELKNISPFCIFIGANGTGKSTIFDVFNFLKRAMETNITVALGELGGAKGLDEVRTRGEDGDIEIEIAFRPANISRTVTYSLVLSEENNRPIVKQEQLSYRCKSDGKPRYLLDFSNGQGMSVTDKVDWQEVDDAKKLDKEHQKLTSQDVLAIKGLGHFEKFPVVVAWRELINTWQVFDFNTQAARNDQQANRYSEVLDRDGKNLAPVLNFLHNHHHDIFQQILDRLSGCVPGIESVSSDVMPDGRIRLSFKHDAFDAPIEAQYISDGTMRMLGHMTLLYHPHSQPFLGVEEPENQLSPKVLEELAEEFCHYAKRGGQVFVSTHSPDFLNAAEVEDVFNLTKKNGITSIKHTSDDEQVVEYMKYGDKMGRLWKQGLLDLP